MRQCLTVALALLLSLPSVYYGTTIHTSCSHFCQLLFGQLSIYSQEIKTM